MGLWRNHYENAKRLVNSFKELKDLEALLEAAAKAEAYIEGSQAEGQKKARKVQEAVDRLEAREAELHRTAAQMAESLARESARHQDILSKQQEELVAYRKTVDAEKAVQERDYKAMLSSREAKLHDLDGAIREAGDKLNSLRKAYEDLKAKLS